MFPFREEQEEAECNLLYLKSAILYTGYTKRGLKALRTITGACMCVIKDFRLMNMNTTWAVYSALLYIEFGFFNMCSIVHLHP